MEPGESGAPRGSCLSILLTGAAACLLLMIVVVATGGLAMYVVWIGLAIFLFGLTHYLLWGRWMQGQKTAGEWEEEEARRKAEAREEGRPGGSGIRRL